MQGVAARLGLYVITSSGSPPGRSHADVALAACLGGAGAVQLRAPELSIDETATAAREIAAICLEREVLFIVNDSVQLALESHADGVHVGQSDDPWSARRRLGPDLVLGISVADLGQARCAADEGADYVAVTVWPTPTKPEAQGVGLRGLAEIAEGTALPVLGIGGIDATNAAQVIAAGAAGVAVISAVGGAQDPVAATRRLRLSVDAAAGSRA